jgi:hypothetical protein
MWIYGSVADGFRVWWMAVSLGQPVYVLGTVGWPSWEHVGLMDH